ncbi:MAG: LacI family DNA-binding transcriptional regulator [Pseudomonadota bacterium]
MKKAKLATVAAEAGVSVATASQALRGAGRISDKTRKRVLAAAEKLSYVPDARAVAMRSGMSREIGLAIHAIANPFNAEVMSGVCDVLESEGYLVSVLDSRDGAKRQRSHLEAFIRSSRSGLIWVPAADTPAEAIELLANHQMPTVTFLRRLRGSPFDHVGIEDAAAVATAVNHLADLGHRNIAYLGGSATFGVRIDRLAGYRKTLAERTTSTPVVWDCEDTKRAGLDAMMALKAAHPEVTAVVCNGDMVAIGATQALLRMGLRPGPDLSIVGFDDIQDAAVTTPPLTTMAVRPYHLGRRLARTLLDRIADPQMLRAVTMVPAELVCRETTAPPASPLPRLASAV